jgi:DNA-directed RNA polymerase beta subunit
VAFAPYKGKGQEDAFVVKREAIERGFGWYVKYMTYSAVIPDTEDFVEEVRKPVPKQGEVAARYHALDEFGIARIGAYVKDSDILIGKVRRYKLKKKDKERERPLPEEENVSVTVGLGDKGYVERILISYNDSGQIIIKIKIRDVRQPRVGDKFSISRFGQKGTIGSIVSEVDFPRTLRGVTPDIIFNMHALPSRMTIGLVLEFMATKSHVLFGRRYNATAFRPRNIDEMERMMVENGYRYDGDEVMISGETGEEMVATMFIGPVAVQALRHHVDDKIQARGRGGRVRKTGQPNHGRSKHGALRYGEQERDATISHGAPNFLRERLCTVSDQITVTVCTKCHRIAIPDVYHVQFKCGICKLATKENERGEVGEFGTLRVPNSFNLVLQMMAGGSLSMDLLTAPLPMVKYTKPCGNV